MSLNLFRAMRLGKRLLKESGIVEPFHSAIFLLYYAKNKQLLENILQFRKQISASKRQLRIDRHWLSAAESINYIKYIRLRLQGEPIQYIIHKWSFLGYPIICSKPVLVPRVETEKLATITMRMIDTYNFTYDNGNKISFFEVGVGTGCISLSLLKHLDKRGNPLIRFKGIDIEESSVDLCKSNFTLNHLERYTSCIEHVSFQEYLQKFIERKLPKFTFVVSNPPYIPENEKLDENLVHESRIALFSGPDGLSLIKEIIHGSKILVERHGFVILEVNDDHHYKILAEVEQNPQTYNHLNKIEYREDIFGIKRYLIAYLK